MPYVGSLIPPSPPQFVLSSTVELVICAMKKNMNKSHCDIALFVNEQIYK